MKQVFQLKNLYVFLYHSYVGVYHKFQNADLKIIATFYELSLN